MDLSPPFMRRGGTGYAGMTPAAGRSKSKKPTIAAALRAQMLAKGETIAWAGDPDLMLSAYEAAGGSIEHPLDRIQAVIAAARRSRLFVQHGYIRACDSSGRREILHPAFKLAADGLASKA